MTAQISAGVLAHEVGSESSVPRTERNVASCSSATEWKKKGTIDLANEAAREVAEGWD